MNGRDEMALLMLAVGSRTDDMGGLTVHVRSTTPDQPRHRRHREHPARPAHEEAARGTNLDYHQWVAFNAIASQPPASAARLLSQMQAGLRIDQHTAAKVIDQVEIRGLITVFGDELRPTDDGRALHARVTPQLQALTQRMYAGLDSDDLAAAYRVLSTLTERGNAIRAEP